jgi:hypothetical protein
MNGVIQGKDVVRHAAVIVRAWGLAGWLACLWAAITRRQTTFLGVLYGAARSSAALGAAEVDRGRPRAARPGAIVLAAAVSGSRSSPLVLAGAPGPCSRWRPFR